MCTVCTKSTACTVYCFLCLLCTLFLLWVYCMHYMYHAYSMYFQVHSEEFVLCVLNIPVFVLCVLNIPEFQVHWEILYCVYWIYLYSRYIEKYLYRVYWVFLYLYCVYWIYLYSRYIKKYLYCVDMTVPRCPHESSPTTRYCLVHSERGSCDSFDLPQYNMKLSLAVSFNCIHLFTSLSFLFTEYKQTKHLIFQTLN